MFKFLPDLKITSFQMLTRNFFRDEHCNFLSVIIIVILNIRDSSDVRCLVPVCEFIRDPSSADIKASFILSFDSYARKTLPIVAS